MKTKVVGSFLCVLLLTMLPIVANVEDKGNSIKQLSDSIGDYLEMELLPDTELESNYQLLETDNHNSFEANVISTGIELIWDHQDGIELDFREPRDVTNNLPDCEELVYISESFSWEYNVLPTQITTDFVYSVNLLSDFDTITWPQLFKVYAWIIDSSGEWTRIYETYGGNFATTVHTTGTLSYDMIARGWGGTIQNNYGHQIDPTDSLQFAFGLGPTYTFGFDENEYWAWMNGVVQVIVDSISLSCVVNPTPDDEELLTPDLVKSRGYNADEITHDIVISEEGDIYTIGSTYDETESMTLTKWNSRGAVYWARSIHGAESWNGFGVAVSDSEVVAVGSAGGVNGSDTLIAKWTHQGLLIWNRTFDIGGNDYGLHVDIGYDGSIFVMGIYLGNITANAYLAKFSSDGTLQWTRNSGYPYSDVSRDLAVAYDGYIYTATYLTIAKWDFDGTQVWNRTGVFSSVKVTQDGNLYTTNLLPPTHLLQQWYSNGTRGWNITLSYDHVYFGEVNLYPVLLDVTPAGWAYVTLTSAEGLGRFTLAIFDTKGLLLWNQTMDPSYVVHPYFFIHNNEVAAVDSSGFVCFAPSVITTRGDLDFCLQFYLTDRQPPIISSPMTIVVIALAIIILVAIPIDYLRRRRSYAEDEDPLAGLTTQVYLLSW